MTAENRPEVQAKSPRELAPITPITEEGVRAFLDKYEWFLWRSTHFNHEAFDITRSSVERQSYRDSAQAEGAKANQLREVLKLLGQEVVTRQISQEVRTITMENNPKTSLGK